MSEACIKQESDSLITMKTLLHLCILSVNHLSGTTSPKLSLRHHVELSENSL